MSEGEGVSQSMPMDTAAATRAADWKPWRVAWVSWQVDHTESANTSGSSVDTAMPTGVTRIAAPFVVPMPRTRRGSSPSRTRSRAAFDDGPSKSSDPWAFIHSSQFSSSRAKPPSSKVTPPAEDPSPRPRKDASVSA